MDNKSVGVRFVVTYHPHLKNISKIIKKHIKHLYADPEVRSVFTPLPFVSFRSVRNLRSHLVRSKLYPQKRKTGSSKFNSPRRLTCNNIKECDTYRVKMSVIMGKLLDRGGIETLNLVISFISLNQREFLFKM